MFKKQADRSKDFVIPLPLPAATPNPFLMPMRSGLLIGPEACQRERGPCGFGWFLPIATAPQQIVNAMSSQENRKRRVFTILLPNMMKQQQNWKA